MAGQGVGFLLQAGTFVLLARLLGVGEYGRFAGAFAVATIVMPYSPLGANMLFMRYVSADPSRAKVYWGNCVTLIVTLSACLVAVLYAASPLLHFASDRMLLVVLVLANCLFQQIVLCASMVFQTFENLRITAFMRLLPNLARFLTLVSAFTVFRRANALQWSVGVLGSTGVSACIAFIWVLRQVGGIEIDLRLIVRRAWEGIGFSFAGSTQSAYNDIDKAILSRDGLNSQNGIYTLAYRIVDFATTPIQSLDGAALPRYFALNREGMKAVTALARKLVPTAALTGVGIACCTLLISPVLPHLVGHDFSDTLVALRWLCWIPLLRGIHQLAGSALTATGYQPYRTTAQVFVAFLNLFANLSLIPTYGWHGAAWVSLGSDGSLGVLNVALLWYFSRPHLTTPTFTGTIQSEVEG